MSRPCKIRLRFAAFAAVFAMVSLEPGASSAADSALTAATNCATPAALSTIDATLGRSASLVRAGEPVTIVAIGSSSTKGAGATTPAMSYPSQLAKDLQDRYPASAITVINHGVGGQDVGEELARLDHDVIAEHPDLVIWQVGTNAVLRRDDIAADEQLIRRGVTMMKEQGIDVVLMDLQYAPRVLQRPAAAEMEGIIRGTADSMKVGLFRRFEIMREWDKTHQLAPASMIGPDGLHMTDASYTCLASQLAGALASNWSSHVKLAKSPRRSPDSVAGVNHSGGAR